MPYRREEEVAMFVAHYAPSVSGADQEASTLVEDLLLFSNQMGYDYSREEISNAMKARTKQ